MNAQTATSLPPNASATAIQPRQHIPALDGLRGIAVTMVIIFHAFEFTPTTGLQHVVIAAQSVLWCGVDLFFVLSGFLITGILLDTKEDPHYFRTFYARRTLRIFPLFYGFLVVILVLPWLVSLFIDLPQLSQAIQSSEYAKLQAGQSWLWTYTHNFAQATGPHRFPGLGHMWSLAVEEQFYLVWPLCVWFLARRKLFWFAVALVIGVAVGRIGMLANGWDTWSIMHYSFTRLDALAFGALGAITIRNPTLLQKVRPRLPHAAAAAAIVTVIVGIYEGALYWRYPNVQAICYNSLAILFTTWVLRVVLEDVSDTHLALLRSRFLRMLGKYSYAMYVFHWPLIVAFDAIEARLGLWQDGSQHVLLGRFLHLVIVFIASLIMAWLSWHLYEKHWLKLKGRFEYVKGERQGSSA